MSLLEWAARSRHESANEAVIVAALLPRRGFASASGAAASHARIATPCTIRSMKSLGIRPSSLPIGVKKRDEGSSVDQGDRLRHGTSVAVWRKSRPRTWDKCPDGGLV